MIGPGVEDMGGAACSIPPLQGEGGRPGATPGRPGGVPLLIEKVRIRLIRDDGQTHFVAMTPTRSAFGRPPSPFGGGMKLPQAR
jgi:hypothetical protein